MIALVIGLGWVLIAAVGCLVVGRAIRIADDALYVIEDADLPDTVRAEWSKA